jgi:GalNAc-alpha-(1->4)-GalNAc-alpha-(1->3)-diNAcBac-PP-undecaprenol alpha-1,4-N-acetyl-D-galactosaminyltransferase
MGNCRLATVEGSASRDKLVGTPVLEICIVVGDLAFPGGAERVACWLANTWARNGMRITLMSMGPNRHSFFRIDHSVKLRQIGDMPRGKNLLQSAALRLRLTCRLRKAVRDTKPDCVISFLNVSNVLTLLACRGLKPKVIVSERTDPHGRRLSLQWELLRRLTYPWADALVVQTDHALSFFPDQIRLRGQIIPNAVVPPDGAQITLRKTEPGKPNRTVIGLGSLRHVKGFDRLIEAFSRIAARHPEWNLVIYGEGSSRPELERQITRLGLANRIGLPGVTEDPYNCLREADLFVLCSRNEGFPNALGEAMACGLPVISFDCKSGPRELIRDGIDGVLVADHDIGALAEQIDRLMGDPVERERLARKAPEVLQRFSPERVLAMWQKALEEVVAHA